MDTQEITNGLQESKISTALIHSIEIGLRLGIIEFQKYGRPWYSDVVDCFASVDDIFADVLFRQDEQGKASNQFQLIVFRLTVLAFMNKEQGIEFAGIKFVGVPYFEFSEQEIKSFNGDVENRKKKFKKQ